VTPIRVTVTERTSAGNLGFLSVRDDAGAEYSVMDLASCYAYIKPGDVGYLSKWHDGAWRYHRKLPEPVAAPAVEDESNVIPF
jgi:hypothetical protein